MFSSPRFIASPYFIPSPQSVVRSPQSTFILTDLLQFSQESSCCVRSDRLDLCKNYKILRSANAKYHSFYSFFYRKNEGDLPLQWYLAFEDLSHFISHTKSQR